MTKVSLRSTQATGFQSLGRWDFCPIPFPSYFNRQMAFLRAEEMWRLAVFQKAGKQGGEIQNAITLVLILPDTVTQQQAVAAGSFVMPHSTYERVKNLGSWYTSIFLINNLFFENFSNPSWIVPIASVDEKTEGEKRIEKANPASFPHESLLRYRCAGHMSVPASTYSTQDYLLIWDNLYFFIFNGCSFQLHW